MIAKLQGILESIDAGVALVQLGNGLTYEVLLPAYTAARLHESVGQTVTLHTFYYIEGQLQGGNLTPRLIGFQSAQDRQFFDLFTSVRGIGNRKALRAMALETAQIAGAIADRDLALLQSLPEVGRRTAETILATLSGKVDRFLAALASAPTGNGGTAGAPGRPGTSGTSGGGGSLTREAIEVLLQLGENRVQAIAWIDEALRDPKDRPRDVQDLIQRVYRIKAGA